jgi:transposase
VAVEVQERLVSVDPEQRAVDAEGGVEKTFRPYDQEQMLLLPPSLAEWLPEDHLARFVSDLVDGALDLAPIYAGYTEERGFPPYAPRLMVKLLIYGYATGTPSSRALERRCHEDVAVRYLTSDQRPDYRSIARFRRRHLDALAELFLQALRLCQKAGLVRLGRVALDGTKLRANASRRKAMSYGRMQTREAQLQAEIAALRKRARELLDQAEATDRAEDARHGARRGDELPAELARREKRLATIAAAKEALEEEARRAAQARPARRRPDDDDPPPPRPKNAAQRNFTDPDSKIMLTADKSFHQCYNGQAVVDDTAQVIVACDLTNQAADAPHLPDLLEQVARHLGQEDAPALTGVQVLADAGYFSEDNVAAVASHGADPYIATQRLTHSEAPAPAPRGRIPNDATPKQRMARKLRTKRGRAVYARRKAIVEPVFDQMDTTQRARRLLLRGLPAARAELNRPGFLGGSDLPPVSWSPGSGVRRRCRWRSSGPRTRWG